MVKTVLTIVLPFLIPFLFFGVYAFFAARKKAKEADGAEISAWENWPWTWLSISGGVFTLAALFFLFYDPNPPAEGVWVPPTVVDGEIVDGHFIPAPEPPADD